MAPRPPPQALDGEDADASDALGSQRFREGAGFWGAVRTIPARVTSLKVKERGAVATADPSHLGPPLTSSRARAAPRHRGILAAKAAAPAGELRSSAATARNSATLSCSGMAGAGRGRRG